MKINKWFNNLIGKTILIVTIALMFGVLGHSNVYAASVGQQLTAPESGWQRIDNTNARITYFGGWNNSSSTVYYGGSFTYSSETTAYAKFRFYGTKVRIINTLDSDVFGCTGTKVDGVVYTKPVGGTQINQALNQDIQGLTLGVHEVILYYVAPSSNVRVNLDAIDIDSTGSLIDPLTFKSVSGITLNKTTDSLQLGQTDTLIPSITPADATYANVTWTSSDPTIATVDSTGKVTAVKAGTVNVTAKTIDGSNLSATCAVTVTQPATGVTLSKTTDSINVGETDTLTATTNPAGIVVTWTSSDPTIATVNSTGKITAIKEGTATITCTTTDGSNLSASCTVTVTNPIVSVGNRATLTIDMNNGMVKQYDLSASELSDFLTWYDSRSKGTAVSYYMFNIPATGPYLTKKDYISFDKIDDFEIQEYNSAK